MKLEILLSGLIGAIIASFFSICYQEFYHRRKIKYLLAKERLGKIYGPLLLILESKNSSPDNKNKKFLYTSEEEKKINYLLFNNYHLIEVKRRKILSYLYSSKKFSKDASNDKIVKAIEDGYIENKKIIRSLK